MSQRTRLQWYRWEGVFAADFSLQDMQLRCRQLGNFLHAKQLSCLIAFDSRFMALQFARYAYLLLEQAGVKVGFCPTPASAPMIELAIDRRRYDTALVISAGNRPHWFSGMQVLLPAGSDNPFTPGIQPLSEPSLPFFPPEPLPASEQTQIDLRTPYVENLREIVDIDLIRRSTLTLFFDPMNGTTSGLFPALLGEGAQTRAIEINREPDPLFNRQVPTPTEQTLPRIRKLVKESDSHLGAAISADGRLLGVTDNTGDLATPLELALLLGQHLGRQHRLRGQIVVPQPAESLAGLAAWENASGQKVELAADPAARIAELVNQDRALLLVGMTAAGEPTIGRYSGSADAALAALLLTEMVAFSGGKLRPLIEDLRKRLHQA